MFVIKVGSPVLIRMQKCMKTTFQNDCRGATKMSTSRTLKLFLLTLVRSCYGRQFATTIFSAVQHYNIAATLFRMVTTLFQHSNVLPACRRLLFPLLHVQQRKLETSARRQSNVMLRWKSPLRIVSCNITFRKIIFVLLCCRYIISVGWDRRINLFSVSYTSDVCYINLFFPLMLALSPYLRLDPFHDKKGLLW